MADLEDDIRATTNVFAKRLAVLLRKSILEAATAALAPHGRRTAAHQTATRRDGRDGVPGAKRTPGQKRAPAELAKVADALVEHIKANPGSRMEAMANALGMTRNDLVYPIKGLIAAKKIRSKGQKRATQYFPA